MDQPDVVAAEGYVGPERRSTADPTRDWLGRLLYTLGIILVLLLSTVVIILSASAYREDDKSAAATTLSTEVANCRALFSGEATGAVQDYNDARTERDRIATEAQAALGQGDEAKFAELSGVPLARAFENEDRMNEVSKQKSARFRAAALKARNNPDEFLDDCSNRYGPP